ILGNPFGLHANVGSFVSLGSSIFFVRGCQLYPGVGILALMTSSPAFVNGGLLFLGPKARLPPRLIQIPERSCGSHFFPFTSTEFEAAAGLACCGAAALGAAFWPPVWARANTVSEINRTNPANGKKRMRRFFI